MKRKDVPPHILAAVTSAQGQLACSRLLALHGMQPTPAAMLMAQACLKSYSADYLHRARANRRGVHKEAVTPGGEGGMKSLGRKHRKPTGSPNFATA